MPTRTEAQESMWDKEIESPELEAAIEMIMENQPDADTRKELAKARKTVKAVTEQYDLEDGQRLRVGRFVIEGKARGGGGFEVPTWRKVTVGKITELAE